MKKKTVNNFLTNILLTITLVLSAFVSPQAIFADTTDENNNIEIANNETKQAVFSIDAGRKYFSEDQIKDLIDQAYVNGYTDVQLILANDATRFYLDDMSITTAEKTYSSDDVKEALTQGNNNYYQDPNGDALTEAEMNRIIAFAKERNIGIIPLINTPGHMDSILDAMEILGIESPRYETSKRTVSLENEEALEFTKLLIDNYAAYFSSYSEIFNIGADEYANDVNTAGWTGIQRSGLYEDFVIYINDLAEIVQSYGMRPMAYNDGIYYNGDDSFGKFDSNLIIAYWTAGWWGFDVAKPELFLDKGHDIISSNDGWYWVLGNYTPSDGIYSLQDFYNRIDNIPFMTVPGKSDASIPALGSIHSVWSDDPSKAHDLDTIFDLMDKFSDTHSEYMEKPIAKEIIQAVEKAEASKTQEDLDSARELVETLNDSPEKIELEDRLDAVQSEIKEAMDAAELVSRMIYNLPNVGAISLEDAEALQAARTAYEDLSEYAKTHVKNIESLELRENRLAALSPEGEEVADKFAVLALQRRIYRLPNVREITLKDSVQVEAIRAEYEALNDASKELFSAQYLKNLVLREVKLVELENRKAATLVQRLIYNLPSASELTLDDKGLVQAVRSVYDNLPEEAKGFVTTLYNLEAREARIVELENE